MLELHPLFPQAFGYASAPELITSELVEAAKSMERSPNSHNEVSTENRIFANSLLYLSSRQAGLLDFILPKLEEYYEQALGAKVGSSLNPQITQSWLTYSHKGEKMHGHRHPNSLVSGVFYINAVEGVDNIIFTKDQPYQHLDWYPEPTSQYSGTEYIVPVKSGDLLLFKSDVHHHFNEVQHNEERISLAFNSWLHGTLGDEAGLTQLKISVQ